ncbi:MAG: hypothetical protein R2734_08675 [Nocardioides sp.]
MARDTEVGGLPGAVEVGPGGVRGRLCPRAGAGVAVRLQAGERAVWTVTQTLRKVYVAG